MFYTSIGCYDAILIQKLYFAAKHQYIMCCTNLYMHVCTLIYTEATYKSQTLTSLTLNVTKQNVTHAALAWTVLQTHCVFTLSSSTLKTDQIQTHCVFTLSSSTLKTDQIILQQMWSLKKTSLSLQGQSTNTDDFIIYTMSYLWPFYVSVDWDCLS